ncbi:MAG: hypothetical protein WCL32_01200 [Planctomycetota bacterium]
MASRRFALAFLILAAFASMGAQYRTANFVVSAQDAQVAKQVGDAAEVYRKEKALMWLGQEMPNWPQPCPLSVTVNMEGPSGATSFHFGQGKVLSIKMEIQGPLDRLLASVLPHEVTHTVFANHFRQPVPRWADEGGSVLSEDEVERERHDRLTRQILNRGQQIPLRRLLGLKEYPKEVMCLYAQGYSMSDFLVKRSNHGVFLNFVGHGMQYGWDSAAQSFYGHRNVEDLEEAWLKHLRDTKSNPKAPPTQVASTNNNVRPTGQPTSRPHVRMTVPPVQPLDPSPVVRGAAPTPDQVGQRFNQASVPPLVPPVAGNWIPAPGFTPPQGAPQAPTAMLPVTLGAIQPEPMMQQVPRNVSPVGFPR